MINELSLKESELRYRRLFETAQDGILILDAGTGFIEDVNPFLIKLLGFSREELIHKKLWEVGPFLDIRASQEAFHILQKEKYIRYEDLPLKSKDGRLIQVEFVSNVYLVDQKKVIQCNIRDITEHKRIVAALQENEKKFHDLVNLDPDGIFIIDLTGRILVANKAMCVELGFSNQELLAMNVWDIIPERFIEQYRERLTKILEGKILKESGEYSVLGKDGKLHFIEILSAPHYSGNDIVGFQGIARDITARKQAEDALRESEAKFRSLVEHLPTVVYMNPVGDEKSTIFVSPQIQTLLGYTPAEWLADPSLWSNRLHPEDRHEVLEQTADPDQIHQLLDLEYRMIAKDGRLVWVHDREILVNNIEGRPQFRQGILLDITQHKEAEQRIQRQFKQLTALSGIDRIIASNFDLKICLLEIVRHITNELGLDAADILILNPSSAMLEYGADRGFRSNVAKKAQVRFGESFAGRVALKQQLVYISNLREESDDPFLKTLSIDEDFVCYYSVPLIAKGEVKGVLEVYNRTALEPDAEWFDFLNSLAGQAAIAIDNSNLFDSLQRSNLELTSAYDATIEGWSRALDLRDNETEWHTRRVTDRTVKLARSFGLSETEMVQVRWGSLLHDIGKMGIPDAILHKAGPLTEDEWVAMRKHPFFAHEMLSPIHYLRLALDIPYCHHEKWDGSGYPNGLKGEQIPLTARIFTVVDVWDALCSDRPYRSAWPENKVREYIRAGAGTHFDPHMVDTFMQTLDFDDFATGEKPGRPAS